MQTERVHICVEYKSFSYYKLLPISATAVKPFVETIAPTISKALNIAENPFTRKVLDVAERLGIKESRDIIRNVRVLERIEPEFTGLVKRDADELNAIAVSLKREPPHNPGTMVISYRTGKLNGWWLGSDL